MHFSFIKKQESGRGMVEMLGVLAVVGVLTIGGINGFRYARDTIHANTIISEVRIRLMALSRHGASKDRAASLQTLKGFRKKSSEDKILNKYEIDLDQPNNEGPTLIINNLSSGICTQLKAKAGIDCDPQNRAHFDLSFLTSASG